MIAGHVDFVEVGVENNEGWATVAFFQGTIAARELSRRERRDVVLVMNRELPPWEEVEPIGHGRAAIEESENYLLYWLRRDRLEGAGGAAGVLRRKYG